MGVKKELGRISELEFQTSEVNLVRAKGLEPPRISPPDPKSGASTNSATPALQRFLAFAPKATLYKYTMLGGQANELHTKAQFYATSRTRTANHQQQRLYPR
jgi:hypothetical protein